ncbi:hypothetical protein HanXRQr2_Chr05g0203841 [Helianthus annuus]|nr:hypothetical protein HanXRQr2_Chr05g0203841 [Helianthus annuus]KAJ0921866.1 hypothetical protein HanPSC8_Chr05g0196691 [Helianthus annuus]
MQVIRLLLNHMLDFRTLGMILELWIRPHFKVLLSNSLETLTIFHQSNYVKTQARMARM